MMRPTMVLPCASTFSNGIDGMECCTACGTGLDAALMSISAVSTDAGQGAGGTGAMRTCRWRMPLVTALLYVAFWHGAAAGAEIQRATATAHTAREGWREDTGNGKGLKVVLKRQARAPGAHRRLKSSKKRSHSIRRSHASSLASNPGNDLVLKDYYNNQYVGQVGIGTPPQMMSVVFDTGSADIWIPGRGCTECGNHQVFDYAQSSSYKPVTDDDGNDRTFEVDYGSGRVLGYQGTETVTLGAVTVAEVGFGEVMYEDEEIRSFMMDGIVGLGFPGLAMVTKPTLLDLYHEQHPDMANHFSVYLSSDPSDEDNPSLLILGGYDLSLVAGEDGVRNASWRYTPVVRYGYGEDTYWSVKVGQVSVSRSGTELAAFCDEGLGCKAIVDTGTSELGIPSLYYADVMKLVTAKQSCHGNTCYSSSVHAFPDLSFTLYPDNVFPLRAQDYVTCTRWGQCVIRLQEVTGTDFWILGDVFMEAYMALFDVDNMRVGFACVGQCSGGSWHGVGGFMDVDSGNPWVKAVSVGTVVLAISSMAYVLFTLLPHVFRRAKGYRGVRQEPLVPVGGGQV